MLREPDRDLIDYLSDALAPEARAAFERRLAEDPELRAEAEAARESLARLRALPPETPGELTRARILAEARRKAEAPERRRFRDVFESPLLQTLALASLVLGIAFVYEDYLPHAGLPSLKDTIRSAKEKRADREEAAYPATAAAKPEAGSQVLGVEAPAAPPAPEARAKAAAPAESRESADAAPADLAASRAAPEKKREEAAALRDAAGKAEEESEADLAKGPAPMAGVLERPAPSMDAARIQDSIKAGKYAEALEAVDRLLAAEPAREDRLLLLELGADAADKAEDDFRRVFYRAQIVQARKAAETPPPAAAAPAPAPASAPEEENAEDVER